MSPFFSNEENSVSMVPPSNSSYMSRNIFSDDHRKYLLKVCGGMVKSFDLDFISPVLHETQKLETVTLLVA